MVGGVLLFILKTHLGDLGCVVSSDPQATAAVTMRVCSDSGAKL